MQTSCADNETYQEICMQSVQFRNGKCTTSIAAYEKLAFIHHLLQPRSRRLLFSSRPVDATHWLLSLLLTVPTSYVSFSVRVTSACVHPSAAHQQGRGERGRSRAALHTPMWKGIYVLLEMCAQGMCGSRSG